MTDKELTLEEIKAFHEAGYLHGQDTRRKAAFCNTFYYIDQWGGSHLADTLLKFKGTFDRMKSVGRNIMADLELNSIDISFNPIGQDLEDTKELANGIYLTDVNSKDSEWSFEYAKNEMCICGMGEWEFYTEYEQQYGADTNQAIKRRPTNEANNCSFWDPDSRMIDKSDADWVSTIKGYSSEGYKKLVHELTGEEIDEINPVSFESSEMSYTFPWVGATDTYYVTTFYHRKVRKENILIMESPLGDSETYWESDLENVIDDMESMGYVVTDTKKVDRPRVMKYIASGEKKLSVDVVNCDYIPRVPCYGEYTYVEDEPHWEGFVAPAMDMQQLINFGYSQMWDHVSRSPMSKPIFSSEQIAGHEDDFEADSTTAYAEINTYDSQGNPLPTQQMGVIGGTNVDPGMAKLVTAVEESFRNVANSGAQQDTIDPDASGKAVNAMIQQIAKQWYFFQKHYKLARLRDAEIYISFAKHIHDVPKTLTITLPDGSRKDVQTMGSIVDEETGDVRILNDLRSTEFKVTAEIGEGYGSERDRTMEHLDTILASTPPGTPAYDAVMGTKVTIMPGVGLEGLRDHFRKQLVLSGVNEPNTPEEEKMMEDLANQPKEPDAATKMAEAEKAKADADMAEVQRKTQQMQIDAQIEAMKLQMQEKELNLKEMELRIKAQQAEVSIGKTQADTQNTMMDSQLKLKDLLTPTANATM